MGEAFERAADLTGSAYVVDLAWLRSTPWRERVAATFDPPAMRPRSARSSKVVVRHRPDSTAAGVLFCGWLASRLGWRPSALAQRGDALTGRCRARRGEVALELRPEEMGAPGLGGVTIEMASGETVSLDRGPGGLRAARRTRDGERAGLDGARRLARRGGHPRRGRAPGAAARPDVQAGARSRPDRWSDDGRPGMTRDRHPRRRRSRRRGRRPARRHRLRGRADRALGRLDAEARVRARVAERRRPERRDALARRRAGRPARRRALEPAHGPRRR